MYLSAEEETFLTLRLSSARIAYSVYPRSQKVPRPYCEAYDDIQPQNQYGIFLTQTELVLQQAQSHNILAGSSRHNFKLFLQELLALEVRLSVYVTIHYVQPKNKRLQDALQSKPDRICHHYPGILHVIKAAAIGIHMFHEDQFFGLESWQ
ncbi:hypothetical protein Plhal710r2_c082g0180531 [Plasmopara halstedii]